MTAFDTNLQTLNDKKDFKEDKLKDGIESGRKVINQISELLAIENK